MMLTRTDEPGAQVDGGVVKVRALGVVVAIRVPRPELREAVEHSWQACLVQEDGDEDGDLRAAGTVVLREPHDDHADSLAGSLQMLTQDVTTAAIKSRAGSVLLFHAGGLSNLETGASVVFVAPGGTGKTTLVRTLGPGRGYISDETIAVGADGRITPYAKPLSVRRAEAPHIKDEIPPGELGLALPAADPWLASIVVLRRDREPGTPAEVEVVDLLDALVLLAPETSSLAEVEAPLRTLADLVERSGGLHLVHYSDAVDLEPLVGELLGRQP
jgi:hypothetical protein